MKNTLFLLFLCCFTYSNACTSMIVSGKASVDGRPLLLKNRDTGTLSNYCIKAKGEKYTFIGLVNAGDTLPDEVWGGHNEVGFAIINTADYNLNTHNEKEELEGVFMRIALGQCATLADFEDFLNHHKHPLCVNTNFGVMDAHGGCAYYEVGNDGYVKFDVNDPKVAPKGYLTRTNFGITGDPDKVQGVERFKAINEFMDTAYKNHQLEATYLATQIPRYLKHGLTHINLYDYMPQTAQDTTMMPFRDFIPRYSTASCILVQGVKKGEKANHTVSWMYVGYPLTTVCVPVIIQSGVSLPKLISNQEDGECWLAKKGLKLKKQLFPYNLSSGHDYINVGALINKKGTGILQRILPIEKQITDKGKKVIEKMRNEKTDTSSLQQYYQWVDQLITEEFSAL